MALWARSGPRRSLLAGLAVLAGYVAAGKAGLALAFVDPSVSAIWAPTGIAIAAFLLIGNRAWLPIALGAFLVNWTTTGIVWTSAAIAAGNTAEGYCAALLTRRFAGGAAAFHHAGSIFRFTLLGALLSTMIGATVGLATLQSAGLVSAAEVGTVWVTWWLGDAAGALLVTPLIVLWARGLPSLREAAELGGFVALVALAALPLFGVYSGSPLAYVFLPVVVAAGYRLGPRGASTVTIVVAAIAVAGTISERGPFAGFGPNDSLLALQGYVSVTALTGLVLGALAGALRGSKALLESAVEERTRQLRTSQQRLSDAQAIAHVGSWDWDVEADVVAWSPEQRRIYGLEEGSQNVTFQSFVDRIHPEDREAIQARVKDALDQGLPYEVDFRIVRPDGEIRRLHSSGRLERNEAGRTIRLYGTTQDLTERLAAEEALRRSDESFRLLADHATDLITKHDPRGICLYVSPAVRAMMGYEPEEIVGRPGFEFVHPADAPRLQAGLGALLDAAGPQTIEWRTRRRDGRLIWLETTAQAVRAGGSGEVESIVAVTRDVTAAHEWTRRLQLLQRTTAIANQATTVEQAMKEALAVICEHISWPIGHVYLVQRTPEGGLAPTHIWHLDSPEDFGELRTTLGGVMLAPGEGLPGEVLQSGRTTWIDDVASDPTFIRVELVQKLGVHAAFASPVRTGDETVAVIEFFHTNVLEPDRELIEVMENVGIQLGQVLRRERGEAALRSSELRFRALAASAHDAIITADEKGRIVYCNDAVRRIFGYTCDELTGLPLVRLIPERYRESHRAGIERFNRTREGRIMGRTVELEGLHKDGSEVPVELVLSWWETEEGLYYTSIIRDITVRRQTEHALNEKVNELAQSNAELALFSYVASHDLREPLRTVASNVQLLARRLGDSIEPDTRRQIDFAVGGVQRMQALIDALLAYSRIGTEGQPFRNVRIEEVLAQAVANLGAAIEEAGGTITHDPLPTVRADQAQLVQLFQNLLANALKFRSDRPPRIHVSSERDGNGWILSVQDNGIGIESQHAEHVFTIFQRLHSEAEYPGTGVGLAVSRRIVERHGGRIWVESDPSEGSTFRFTLPEGQPARLSEGLIP